MCVWVKFYGGSKLRLNRYSASCDLDRSEHNSRFNSCSMPSSDLVIIMGAVMPLVDSLFVDLRLFF